MKQKMIALSIGISASILFMVFTGITTVIIPNSRYIRMTPIALWDYIVYALTGILLGIFVGVYYYKRRTSINCANSATIGTVFGLFTYGCSLCNALLMSVIGATGIITYFEPVRPWLGLVGILLLFSAIFYQVKK
jgi:hypothetical protein